MYINNNIKIKTLDYGSPFSKKTTGQDTGKYLVKKIIACNYVQGCPGPNI